MNISRLKKAYCDLGDNMRALSWLKERGLSLSDETASFTVTFSLSEHDFGKGEAETFCANCVKEFIPDIVDQAILNCENNIELANSVIREELGFTARSTHPEGAEQ